MVGHRLLVVEDHTTTRDALRAHYERLGWHVDVAGTVAEGLALLDAGPEPCCLILDLVLPDGLLPKPIRLSEVWTEPCRVCGGGVRSGAGDGIGGGKAATAGDGSSHRGP